MKWVSWPKNVNNLLESLQQLIVKIRDVATKVKGETSLIANGALDIAKLSNEQNQEIEQWPLHLPRCQKPRPM